MNTWEMMRLNVHQILRIQIKIWVDQMKVKRLKNGKRGTHFNHQFMKDKYHGRLMKEILRIFPGIQKTKKLAN